MIDITVNHNDDEITISVDGRPGQRFRSRYTGDVEQMIKHLMNRLDEEWDEHDQQPVINLIRIDEDTIKTIETW